MIICLKNFQKIIQKSKKINHIRNNHNVIERRNNIMGNNNLKLADKNFGPILEYVKDNLVCTETFKQDECSV